jgi:hypothetical protein
MDEDCENIVSMTLLMPSLGFLVVLDLWWARMPREGVPAFVRSRMTPSVFVLENRQVSVYGFDFDASHLSTIMEER